MKEKNEQSHNEVFFDVGTLAQKVDFWTECRSLSMREQLNALLDAVEEPEQPKAERCIDMDMLDRNTSPEASVIRDLLTPQKGEHELSADTYRQIDADERELNYLLRLQAAADALFLHKNTCFVALNI